MPARRFVCSLTFATLVSVFVASAQADGERVELNGGPSEPASLVAVTAEGVRLQPTADGAAPRSVSFDELHRWGAPAPPARRPLVVLRQGSRLVAAPTWTLDGSIRLVDDQFTVSQTLLHDLKLPRKAVARVLFETARDPEYFADVIQETRAADAAEDRVWLASGDSFGGRIVSINRGRIEIVVREEPLEFNLSQVAAVRLAGDATAPPPRVAVGLRDGGLLLAESASLDQEGELQVLLAGGLSVRGRRPDAVALVQPLSGAVTYLSDLTPIDYRHSPYLSLAWPYARDENLFGGQLTSSGRRWLKGLAVHSSARLVYRVPAGASRLETMVALDGSSAEGFGGSVRLRVLVARDGKFSAAFRSEVVRSGDPPLPVSIDVAGAQAVALVVEHADYGDAGDHANWLDARFVE